MWTLNHFSQHTIYHFYTTSKDCHLQSNRELEKYEHQASKRLSYDYFFRLDKAIETSDYLSTNRLKILVVNPYYGGSLPTAKYCVRALNEMGHHAESVECDKFAEGFFSIKKQHEIKLMKNLYPTNLAHFMGQFIAAKAADYNQT